VFWTENAEELQGTLESGKCLKEQLFPDAFSHPYSPNWQDHSTATECNLIEEKLGGPDILAHITGSKAHHVSPDLLNLCDS
jgi:xylulokinase